MPSEAALTTRPVEPGAVLLRWARDRLREELGGPQAERPVAHAWGSRHAATFVTLRWRDDDRLQGCIGTLEPRRSIIEDVGHNVVSAALGDPRAEPITLEDIDRLSIHISILSALEPIRFTDEASALAAIRPGRDGIVIEWLVHRATFLPSMWPRLPQVHEFMATLKRKAGLPPDFWDDDLRLFRYTVEEHADPHA